MLLTIDLTDLDLSEYFSTDADCELKLTEAFINEIKYSLVCRLRETSEYKSIISKELHEPIRKVADEYLKSGAIEEAVKECNKEKTRWDNLTYYETFKSEVEEVVDKHISHFESKLEEAIRNRIRLRIDEFTEEYISRIYKNSNFADLLIKTRFHNE